MHPYARRVVFAGLLVVIAVAAFRGRVGREMADFEVYRRAGARVVAGEPLYRVEDGHWQFKYLPAFAFAVAPLALLPPQAARGIWFAGLVILLVALLTLTLRLLPARRARAWLLVAGTVLAMGKFYAHELLLGQSNLLLAVLVMIAVAQLRGGRDIAAGAALGAATVVKPYAVLFLPYLVLRGRRAAAAAYLVVVLAALAVPALRYGVAGDVALLAGLWDTVTGSTPSNLLGQDNISFAAMYAKWFGIGPVAAALAAATSVAAVAAAGWVLARRAAVPLPEYLDAAVLLTLIPLLSPQGWDYVLLVSTPAVMLLLNHLADFTPAARVAAVGSLAIVGLTFFDLMGRALYARFMATSIITLAVLVEVTLLLQLRRKRIA